MSTDHVTDTSDDAARYERMHRLDEPEPPWDFDLTDMLEEKAAEKRAEKRKRP